MPMWVRRYQPLANGHRSKYYGILDSYAKNDQINPFGPGDTDDDNVLGVHLFTVNQKRDKADFNKYFVFDILATTSPDNLRKCEQLYIDKLRSLYPLGLKKY